VALAVKLPRWLWVWLWYLLRSPLPYFCADHLWSCYLGCPGRILSTSQHQRGLHILWWSGTPFAKSLASLSNLVCKICLPPLLNSDSFPWAPLGSALKLSGHAQGGAELNIEAGFTSGCRSKLGCSIPTGVGVSIWGKASKNTSCAAGWP